MSHERGQPFPSDVSDAALLGFESEGNSGSPRLASEAEKTVMLLEWKKSTSKSKWNARALAILSTELHRELKDGKMENFTYNPKTMDLRFCEKQIKQRIDRLRRDKIAFEENRSKIEKERIEQV